MKRMLTSFPAALISAVLCAGPALAGIEPSPFLPSLILRILRFFGG